MEPGPKDDLQVVTVISNIFWLFVHFFISYSKIIGRIWTEHYYFSVSLHNNHQAAKTLRTKSPEKWQDCFLPASVRAQPNETSSSWRSNSPSPRRQRYYTRWRFSHQWRLSFPLCRYSSITFSMWCSTYDPWLQSQLTAAHPHSYCKSNTLVSFWLIL